MFLEERLDYSEIGKIVNLSNYKISNIITEAIRRIDYCRFNMVELFEVKDDLDDFYAKTSLKLTDLDKKIIELKYFKYKDNDEIAAILNMKKVDVNKCISRFRHSYLDYLVSDVEIDDSDIFKELKAYVLESVTSEISKQIVSYTYGIKCKYNKDGVKLSSKEIKDLLGANDKKLCLERKNFMKNVKLKKMGLLRNSLSYIPRKELKAILKDPHVPISTKEEKIICHLFQLNNYEYKSVEELSEIYQESERSIIRRYQRAIINIYKYLSIYNCNIK